MKNLKTIEAKVKAILQKNEDARNDDMTLYLIVCNTYLKGAGAITYIDMIIVQLRAMCIENERYKNNYTAQILLRKIGEDALANNIDKMLSEEFYDGSIQVSIKTALKIVADEFICHYDNFDGEKSHRISLAEIFINRLMSPYEEKNLDYIMKVLINCIGDGLAIQK